MAEKSPDPGRRRLLTTAAAAVGGIGVGAAAVPFVQSMLPSARAKALGGDIEVDIADLQPGQLRTVQWRGMAVLILHRTPEMLRDMRTLEDRLRDANSEILSQQPEYARNWHRSIRPEILVVMGVCTHLGCLPAYKPEHSLSQIGPWWKGGFYCPCHFSEYDLAGRVFKGTSPAPRNLPVPPHHYVSETKIVIGDEAQHT